MVTTQGWLLMVGVPNPVGCGLESAHGGRRSQASHVRRVSSPRARDRHAVRVPRRTDLGDVGRYGTAFADQDESWGALDQRLGGRPLSAIRLGLEDPCVGDWIGYVPGHQRDL